MTPVKIDIDDWRLSGGGAQGGSYVDKATEHGDLHFGNVITDGTKDYFVGENVNEYGEL